MTANRNLAFLVLAAASWGLGTVVSKQAVAEIPPLTLLAVQLAVSVAFLTVVARVRGERLPTGREGRLLGRLGLLNPGLAYALSLIGLAEITASTSVLLWSAEPVLILALAAVVLGERLRPGIIVASVIAVAGLTLVVFEPHVGGSLVGVSLTLAGVGVCAVYTVAARKWLLPSDSSLAVVLAQQRHALAFAAVALLLVGLTGGTVAPRQLTAGAVVSTVASGLLYYALAYAFYLTALRAVRASIAASSFYLIPVFGLAGAALAGERLEPQQWVGALVVVGSVGWITARSAASAAEEAQPSSAAASAQMATTPSAARRS